MSDEIEFPDENMVRTDHPLGIYFSMAESEYFSDIAVGSSDMATLSYSATDFWFGSRFNPLYEPDEDTPAKLYGRAVHHIILEGRQKFERLYAPKLHSWSTTEGKKEKARLAEAGMSALPFKDWERALQTGAVIRGNTNLREAFTGSVGHEVSVFWSQGGIKRRARFDGLKERAIVDLKNISNERKISFKRAAMRKIDDYGYHIQAAHYLEGRLAMRALLDEGKVFGDHDGALLRRVVDSREFAFVWIFLQSSGAPNICSWRLSYKPDADPPEINEMFGHGRARIDQAEANWKKFVDKFGTDLPWIVDEPIEEFDVDKMPPWFLRGGEGEGI